jgi:glycine cleavage system regulatory protein
MLRTAAFFVLDVPRIVAKGRWKMMVSQLTRRGDEVAILKQVELDAKAAARRRGSRWFREPYRGQ